MARCPEVNSSGGEPPFLPPSFPQSGTEFAPPISNFYSEISFIFAVNVLYLSCDCRTRLKKRRKRVSFWGSSAIAAYPRKGTITPRCSPGGWSAEYCSLSPQGDDNPKFYTSFLTTNNCSLSPQGDDNHGTRTEKMWSSNCSLSPQGDDNREGAKNSASKKMRSFSFANLNSLFSVGCPSMNGTIAAAVIFSLLRLLHSDKMCYNKANSKHLLQN